MEELTEAYTAEDIARHLKLHLYTIRRLTRVKKIHAFRVGVKWIFDKTEREQWRNEQNKQGVDDRLDNLRQCY